MRSAHHRTKTESCLCIPRTIAAKGEYSAITGISMPRAISGSAHNQSIWHRKDEAPPISTDLPQEQYSTDVTRQPGIPAGTRQPGGSPLSLLEVQRINSMFNHSLVLTIVSNTRAFHTRGHSTSWLRGPFESDQSIYIPK